MKLGQLISLQTGGPGSGPRPGAGKKTTAPDYMQELISYGGKMVPRGYVYQLLINVAKAQGHANPRVLADRWMQGYDLRKKLKAVAVKDCPFCGTTNNIKIRNSDSAKCKNCGRAYELG